MSYVVMVLAFLSGLLISNTYEVEDKQARSSGSTRVISPTVVAMWKAFGSRTGPSTLAYLILWRGAPGWAVHDTSTVTRSGMTGGAERRTARYGPHELTVIFDHDARRMSIQGKTIFLDHGNVILVEDADRPERTRIVKVLAIDGAMPAGNGGIQSLVRTLPELGAFLQCSIRLPNATAEQQRRLDAICAEFVASTAGGY